MGVTIKGRKVIIEREDGVYIAEGRGTISGPWKFVYGPSRRPSGPCWR
jgi:hypothetical protein